MQFLPGTDFISSGYSAVPNYDNMFAGSNEDAEDFDDYNVLQRDLKVDGGLRPVREEDVIAIRNKAARALQAVFAGMGLPPITDEEVEAATYAHGSKICRSATSSKTSSLRRRSSTKTVTGWKWVKALAQGSFNDVAQDMLNIQKAKLTGDYLHTSAIIVGDGRCCRPSMTSMIMPVRQQAIACRANAGKRLKTSRPPSIRMNWVKG